MVCGPPLLPARGPPAELRVNGLGGHICTVAADPAWLVRDVKAAIEASAGVPAAQQRLLAGSSELHDKDSAPSIKVAGQAEELTLLRRSPEQVKWLADVEANWTRFLDAPPRIRADREVVTAAVRQQGSVLRYAAKELLADRRVVLAAVGSEGDALQHAAEELKGDKEVVMSAVQRSGRALGHALPSARADPDLVRMAVHQHGPALQWASEELRSDRDLVLAAVCSDGKLLRYASDRLRADPEVVAAAVHENRKAFKLAARSARLDVRVLEAMGLEPDSD